MTMQDDLMSRSSDTRWPESLNPFHANMFSHSK